MDAPFNDLKGHVVERDNGKHDLASCRIADIFHLAGQVSLGPRDEIFLHHIEESRPDLGLNCDPDRNGQ
jgi:hypothetical protein